MQGSSQDNGQVSPDAFEAWTAVESENEARASIALVQNMCRVRDPDDPPDYTFLQQPLMLSRLHQISTHYPVIYAGIFEPWVRSQPLLHWPTVDRRIQSYSQGIDPTTFFDPFSLTDAASLMQQQPMPRRWLIPGMIADGLTMLGGSPKGGKTYLAYSLALAVATGGKWCGEWNVPKGKVVYISLEDDRNDTNLRIRELLPEPHMPPGSLYFQNGTETMPTFGNGLLEWLTEAMAIHQPRLLIIDPISYLYVLKKTGTQFEETKDMLLPLRNLAKAHHCACVCLDHRRKRSKDDVLMVDTLYGSVAKQAVADGLIMVNRDHEDMELDMTIRHGQEQRVYLSFTFEGGRCLLAYKGSDTHNRNHSNLRQQVLDLLRTQSTALSYDEILCELRIPVSSQARNQLKQILWRCMKSREVEKTNRGRYLLGDSQA